MSFTVRMFALFIAIAGLASASFAPTPIQSMVRQRSMVTNDPGTLKLPGPLPCQADGSCVAPSQSAR